VTTPVRHAHAAISPLLRVATSNMRPGRTLFFRMLALLPDARAIGHPAHIPPPKPAVARARRRHCSDLLHLV